MRQMEHHIGERVLVSHEGRRVRGWLEQADDVAVVVRLPSLENPEAPGDGLATFPCPPPPESTMFITCTLAYDHRGIMIGYLDPTWSRTEAEARRFEETISRITFGGVKFPVAKGKAVHPVAVAAPQDDAGRLEKRVRQSLRVRAISLAVPLQEAHIWNDHGRMWMHDQARRELEAEAAT